MPEVVQRWLPLAGIEPRLCDGGIHPPLHFAEGERLPDTRGEDGITGL